MSLNAVSADSNELIYLSTNRGFFVYDGKNLTPINWLNFDSQVQKIAIAGDSLIIGENNGNLTIASINQQKILQQHSVTGVAITALTTLADGAVLVGSAGDGIFLFTRSGETIQINDPLSDPFVNAVFYAENSHTLTIGTDRGIDQLSYNPSTGSLEGPTSIHSQNDLYGSIISAADTLPHLLVAGHSTGINRIENGEIKNLSGDQELPHGELFKAFGQEWLLKDENKLYRITGLNSAPEARLVHDFTESAVVEILEVKEGYLMIWLRNGKAFLLPAHYAIYDHLSSFSLSGISAVCPSSRGGIWVARNDTLAEIRTSKNEIELLSVIPLPEPTGFPVISVAEQNNYLLAGTFGDGLFVFDLTQQNWPAHLREENGLDNNSILDIATGTDNIWISTMSGVQYIKGNPLELYSLSGSPGYVYCLKAGSAGNLYVGSQGESMFVAHGTVLNPIVPEDSPNYSFISIAEDRQGLIWGLTTDSRLFYYDGQQLKPHVLNNELEQLGAYRMFSLPSGRPGLISETALYDISVESGAREIIGGPDLFKSNFQNISAVDQAGNLWLARPENLIVVSRDALQEVHIPKIEISGIHINGERIPAVAKPSLAHNENDVNFELRSVWHDPYRPVVNEFRLLGLDTNWRSVVEDELHFVQLNSGAYELQLRTLFGPTLNPVYHTTYSFSIMPPFYLSWWFLSAAAVLFISLLIAAVKWRDRRLKAALALRSERIQTQFEVLKNQINPHFLFNSFNTLAALIPDDPARAEISRKNFRHSSAKCSPAKTTTPIHSNVSYNWLQISSFFSNRAMAKVSFTKWPSIRRKNDVTCLRSHSRF